MFLMAARSDQYAANAERTPATIAPTAGLGAALARLPPPWTVFRQGGISPFDTSGGEIYGGLYIALHPERGIALVDVEPAQPAKALPRLGALLRETGLPEFAGAAPPAIAMVLTRADVPLASLRLSKAFEAAPFIKSPTWTKVVAGALMARFPDLKQVQRAGGTASASDLAESSAAAAAAATAPAAAAAAPTDAPRTPAFVAAAPAAAAPAQPARSPTPRLTAGDPTITDGATPPRYTRPSTDSLETEPEEWRDWLPRGRLIQGVVVVAVLAAAALFLLPMRHTGQPGVGSRAPEPAPASVQVTPPPQPVQPPPAAPPEATGQATIAPPASTPLPGTASPAVAPPPLPPVDQAASGTPAAAPPESAAPSAPSVQAPVLTPPPPPAPAQTAIVPPPASPPVATPPSVPSLKAPPPLSKTPQPAAIPAKKPPKAETPQSATKEERPRKREADQPVLSPEETVTVDGVTYIKGREPRTLGAGVVPVEPGDSSNRAPPQDAAPVPDHTPGGITLSPPSGTPTQEPAGTVQDSPQ
jgi:hypothetical protein